jgi:hypothetical protein
VIGVHIATVNIGTLAHVMNLYGILWEAFNTSGKEIYTLHYLLFTLETTIMQTTQNLSKLHASSLQPLI